MIVQKKQQQRPTFTNITYHYRQNTSCPPRIRAPILYSSKSCGETIDPEKISVIPPRSSPPSLLCYQLVLVLGRRAAASGHTPFSAQGVRVEVWRGPLLDCRGAGWTSEIHFLLLGNRPCYLERGTGLRKLWERISPSCRNVWCPEHDYFPVRAVLDPRYLRYSEHEFSGWTSQRRDGRAVLVCVLACSYESFALILAIPQELLITPYLRCGTCHANPVEKEEVQHHPHVMEMDQQSSNPQFVRFSWLKIRGRLLGCYLQTLC